MVVLIREPRFVFEPNQIRLNQRGPNPFLYIRIKNAAMPVIRRIGSDFYASVKSSLKTSLLISPLFLRVASIIQAGSLAAVGAAVVTAFIAYNIASTIFLFGYKFNAFLLERPPLRNLEIKNTFSNQINPSHIKVEEERFDFSQIPEDIKLESLLTFLDKSSFKDDVEIRNGINKIIQYINLKIPYVGTPPAGSPRLVAFYDNLKNMLRFTIYKLIKEEKEFLNSTGGVVPVEGSEDFKKYRDILDAKEVVLNLMYEASGYCAAAWMGQALALYSMEKPTASESFDKTILNHLADVRKGLLIKLISNEINNQPPNLQVHFYAAVMEAVGPAFGVPGSDLYVEHISHLNASDKKRFIQRLAQLYSPKKILDEVKDLFSKSQEFREQAYDWIKDQVGDWKQKEYEQKADHLISDLRKIASEKVQQNASQKEHIDLLFRFIENLKKEPGFLKENYSTKSSIGELFNQFLETTQFKPYFDANLKREAGFLRNSKLPNESPVALRNAFRCLIEEEDKNSKGRLLAAIKDVFNGNENSFSQVIEEDVKLKEEDIKLKNMQRYLQDKQLPDIVIRSTQEVNSGTFKEKILLGCERARRIEFLSEIAREDGNLSNGVFKWILIENGVLSPASL